MIQIFSAGRTGRDGTDRGSTRGPRGPKNLKYITWLSFLISNDSHLWFQFPTTLTSHLLLHLFVLNNISSSKQGEDYSRLKKILGLLGMISMNTYIECFFYWAAQNMTKYWKISLGISVVFFFFFWGGGRKKSLSKNWKCDFCTQNSKWINSWFQPGSWRRRQWREPCRCPPSRGSQTTPSGRQTHPCSPEHIKCGIGIGVIWDSSRSHLSDKWESGKWCGPDFKEPFYRLGQNFPKKKVKFMAKNNNICNDFASKLISWSFAFLLNMFICVVTNKHDTK